MADIGKSIMDVFMKGMTAVGNKANDIAASTKAKVDEMNLNTRRGEIMSAMGEQVYEMWKAGERTFPKSLLELLGEIGKLDEQLSTLRTPAAPAEEEKEEPAAEPVQQEPEKPAAPSMPDTEEEEEPVVRYHTNPAEWNAPSMTIPGEEEEDEYAAPKQEAAEAVETAESFADSVNRAFEAVDSAMAKVGSLLGDKIKNLTRTIQQEENQQESEDDQDK